MHRKLWRCAKMHIWALTYFEEVGHITECCYFDAMNFFWFDYCSPKWELEVQHSRHMWVQCLPMGTKWQCMPMGMKVQHSGHMSAIKTKVSFLNVSTFKSAQVPWTYFFINIFGNTIGRILLYSGSSLKKAQMNNFF